MTYRELASEDEALVPFPPEWEGGASRGPWWMVPLTSVLVALGLLLVPVAAVEGDLRFMGLSVLVLMLFCSLLVLQVAGRRWPGRRRPVVESAGVGVRFPYRRMLWHAMVGSVVVGLPAVVLLLWLVFTDPDPSRRTHEMMVVGPVLLAYLGLAAWNLATGRLRHGHVLLDEGGVTHRSWGARAHIAWEDVRTVRAQLLPVAKARPEVVVQHRDGRTATYEKRARWLGLKVRGLPDLVIEAFPVAGDAALLAHAIAFYADHPELRPELGDDRALRRVRAGQAVVPDLGWR